MTVQTAPSEQSADSFDPAIAERLERLTQRSKAAREAKERVGAPPPSPTAKKRRHAAQRARWISLALSIFATAALTVSFSFLSLPQDAQLALAASVPTQVAPEMATTTDPASSGAPTPTAAPVVEAFDGEVVNTRWGPVQVKAQISNRQLTDVVALQYPNDRGTSIEINNFALPRLRAEALTAQSAQVDSISGASVTSLGYVQSLQSAIDAAQAAGAIAIS